VGEPTSPLGGAIARWRRRVRGALLLGGFADGVAATALVAAAAVLVLRLFGVVASPSPAWALALLLPAAAAALRLRRADPTVAEAALHLDRRLGLEGLLLAGVEADASAWRARLSPALARVREALPRVRVGRALARAALPVAALAGVLLLPPPAAAAPTAEPALGRALDRLEVRLRELAKVEGLSEEARRGTEERLRALGERRDEGEALSWADVDAAAERLDHEARRRAADLAKAKAAADAFARSPPADANAARAEAASLVTAAGELGLLDDLPESVVRAAGAEAGAVAATADAAALEALAKALSEAAGDRQEALAALGVVDPAAAEALERLLEKDPRLLDEGEEACASCRGDRPEGCDG
jgi:colicin import membrane protein